MSFPLDSACRRRSPLERHDVQRGHVVHTASFYTMCKWSHPSGTVSCGVWEIGQHSNVDMDIGNSIQMVEVCVDLVSSPLNVFLTFSAKNC